MQLLLRFLILASLLLCGIASAAEVSRAQFTLGIDNREPVSMVDSIDSNSHRSITFFTELDDMSGQTVTHQWTHNDKVMFEKTARRSMRLPRACWRRFSMTLHSPTPCLASSSKKASRSRRNAGASGPVKPLSRHGKVSGL